MKTKILYNQSKQEQFISLINSASFMFKKTHNQGIAIVNNLQSENNINQNIQIAIETSRNYYFAGEYIQGSIYLKCQQQSNYPGLYIRLCCQEKVRWTQGRGSHSSPYQNQICSYDQILTVQQFENKTISRGFFIFPFKILLPSDLSGTYFEDQFKNYIRFSLRVKINSQIKIGQFNYSQYLQNSEIFLTIIQPMRGSLISLSESTLNRIEGFCCIDYGTVKITLNCDKNFIQSGQNFNIDLQIDNSLGKKQVYDTRIFFKRYKTMISRGGHQKYIDEKRIQLVKIQKSIKQGTKQKFSASSSIPHQFSDESTVIGNTTGKYYTLCVNAWTGQFSLAIHAQLHLIFQSREQKIQNNPKIPLSTDKFIPIINKKVEFNNLNPYMYKPRSGILYHNRQNYVPNQNNLNNLQSMKNAGDKFQSPPLTQTALRRQHQL